VLWTLKDATLQVDYSLSNNLDILAQTKAGTNYYIACGTVLYTRPESGKDWTKIDFPANTSHCSAFAYFNTRLYGGFISPDGTGKLYSTDPSTISWIWEDDPEINGKQIAKLMVVNSILVVSAVAVSGSSSSFSLYYRNGTDYQPAGFLQAQSKEVISVVYDNPNYFALTEDALYSATDLSAFTTTPVTLNGLSTSSGVYRGMLISAPNYYISTKGGVVFISTNQGTDWTASSQKKVLEQVVMFEELAQVGSNILVGAKSCGFFQMNDGDATFASFERPTDLTEFINSDLYTADVRSFFVDGTTVFFCTAGQGLFRNTYSGTAWGMEWIHE
jgi:hypothetical protein